MLIDDSARIRRNGGYFVGSIPFYSKMEALAFATKTNDTVRWSFNEDVFSAIDWTIPIADSLPELYRKRAQQLRDNYEYVSLFFSGGIDSTNILHAFIDNNIFLDEIVMYRPKYIEHCNSKTDTSSDNNFAEIEFAAVPYLKNLVKNDKTVIRFIDMDIILEEALTTLSICNQLQLSCYGSKNALSRMAMFMLDKSWNAIYESGKTIAHVAGVEKPIINHTAGDYTFRFHDGHSSFNFLPVYDTPESERIRKHQAIEYFYWTPDLPELVIKQCQVLKAACEFDYVFKLLFTNSALKKQDILVGCMRQIYSSEVCSIRNLFHTKKPIVTLLPTAKLTDWYEYGLSKNAQAMGNIILSQSMNLINRQFIMNTTGPYFIENELPMIEPFSISAQTVVFFAGKTYNL